MKILVCDHHRMMREGLRALLEKEGLEIVGEAVTGRELLAMCRLLRPDIVLMDASMPDLNGIDATRQLVTEIPGLKIIGLSVDHDRRHMAAMFAAGASGYLPKSSGAEELSLAIRTVASGRQYRTPLNGDGARHDPLCDLVVANAVTTPTFSRPLSSRERDVLQLLAEGKSSKEIAANLHIGVTTVETHRRQIMNKLGLRTIAGLTKYAIRLGLTPLD